MFGALTEKEYEIMSYIWENEDGMSFNEIFTSANMGDTPLRRQTVNTHVHHLIEKGFVKAEGADRRRLYYPLVPRDEYDNQLANNIVNQLFKGSLKNFVSALTSNRNLTDKEISELKALIRKKKEEI